MGSSSGAAVAGRSSAIAVERLDEWLRTTFVERNTVLEEAYFAAGVEFLGDPDLDAGKQTLLHDGAALAGALDVLPERAAGRYELLGMVGFVLGACRRHETEDDEVLAPAWAVARRLGESLGVAPRYVFSHQAFFNSAREDRFRTFTALLDEARFVELNALGVLAYGKAAAALRRPAASVPADRYAALSASGPPLDEVIAQLDRLRGLRTATEPLERLRELIA
jgi:monodechloroaminopyrrolnitrin synthase PrnB-like protein